jgi:undecaprenyl diphosphate synthase
MKDIERVLRETGIELDRERIPRHIAIIMDGNGRWATQRSLPRAFGHVQGYATVQSITTACTRLGIDALTLYAFSTENWNRPKEEVDGLMTLIENSLWAEVPTMHENQTRLKVSGRVEQLPDSLQKAIREISADTSGNTALTLNLAINYGGRSEILDAVQRTAGLVQSGEMAIEDITEDYFSGQMYTSPLPDPDLLIRTAGELRVSNFLLWQIAYAEIYVTSTLWPDFSPTDLCLAIADYQKRVRKFGKVVEQLD